MAIAVQHAVAVGFVDDLTAVILDRPRNHEYMAQVRAAGAMIALIGDEQEGYAPLRTFGTLLSFAVAIGLSLIAWTPLAGVWFRDVSGLTDALAAFALTPIRILAIIPGLTALLSFQRAVMVIRATTNRITWATIIEVVGTIVVMWLAISVFDVVGAAVAREGQRVVDHGNLELVGIKTRQLSRHHGAILVEVLGASAAGSPGGEQVQEVHHAHRAVGVDVPEAVRLHRKVQVDRQVTAPGRDIDQGLGRRLQFGLQRGQPGIPVGKIAAQLVALFSQVLFAARLRRLVFRQPGLNGKQVLDIR